MSHLKSDALINLAEKTSNYGIYNKDEISYLDHLKSCKDCYNQFCSLLALMDATSPIGLSLFSTSKKSAKEGKKENKILAIINISKKKINEAISIVMEQIDTITSPFVFETPVTIGARGTNQKTTTFKFEEIDNQYTFISYDEQNKSLFIQIDTKTLQSTDLKINIVFSNGTEQSLPYTIEGRLLKGKSSKLPDDDFQIRIEYT